MSCSDNGIYNDHHRYMAMLCGLITVLEDQHSLDNVLDAVDWKQVGMSRMEFTSWRLEHKRRDELRKNQEAEDQRKRDLMSSAFAKMTDAEQRVFQGLR